jgi:hypothetical protein
MITYMRIHPEAYDEAIQLAVTDKQPFSKRAAWLLWSCIQKNDPRIRTALKTIIKALSSKTDDHQRELIKILLLMELPEDQEGFLLQVCTEVWEKTEKNPSVRFTAFKLMVKIAEKHPEIYNEMILLTQDKYMESLSSAAQKSIRKMMDTEKHKQGH